MLTLLTSSVGVLMAGAAAAGVLVDGIYRDNALVRASWLGNDLVTLLVAVPLLTLSTVSARMASDRGLLLSLGLLAYATYNFAFYLLGAAFNSLFLVYVAIVALATLGLIAGLTSRQLRSIVRTVALTWVERTVGVVVTFVSLGLGTFWIGLSVDYVVAGEVPMMVEATGHPTNLAGALDLWLVVTFGLLGGIWLTMGRAWGYVVSVIWSVEGAVYMAALASATPSAFQRQAVDSLAQLGMWVPIGLIFAIGVSVLLRASPGSGEERIARPTPA